MLKEQLAKRLDGHEIRNFDAVVATEKKTAAEGGLVIVSGASDDIMEFRGALDEEFGFSALISGGDFLTNECVDGDRCPYFSAIRAKAFEVEALWCAEADLAWTYRLDVEHSTFTILQDGEPWCRGVVFALADIPDAGDNAAPDAILLTANQAADLALCLEEVKGRFPGDVSAALRQAHDVAADGCGRNYLEVEEDALKHEEVETA